MMSANNEKLERKVRKGSMIRVFDNRLPQSESRILIGRIIEIKFISKSYLDGDSIKYRNYINYTTDSGYMLSLELIKSMVLI